MRLRLGERRPLRRVLQASEHLSQLDVVALLDQHFDQGTGDLSRNGRLSARGDVAGGIEHRGVGNAAGDRLRHHRAHRQRRAAGQAKPGAGADQRNEQQHGAGYPAATPGIGATVPLGAVDAQLSQQRLVFRVRWHRSHDL